MEKMTAEKPTRRFSSSWCRQTLDPSMGRRYLIEVRKPLVTVLLLLLPAYSFLRPNKERKSSRLSRAEIVVIAKSFLAPLTPEMRIPVGRRKKRSDYLNNNYRRRRERKKFKPRFSYLLDVLRSLLGLVRRMCPSSSLEKYFQKQEAAKKRFFSLDGNLSLSKLFLSKKIQDIPKQIKISSRQ